MAEDYYVIGTDMMCFWADGTTLDAKTPSQYDAWAWSDPLPGPKISTDEWDLRRAQLNEAQRG